MTPLILTARSQSLVSDAGGHSRWQIKEEVHEVAASQAALLLCDVWDKHWCRGASERVDAMVPRMNAVAESARQHGVRVIHAPSDTMDYYEETPGRKRMQDAPECDLPEDIEHEDPPMPVDASDGGSDTGEIESSKAWARQHPGIEIDPEQDGITDKGEEVYRFLGAHQIDHLLIMGVHTNMCVLNRTFAIKQMVRWGIRTFLIRDLTDAMYNPAKAPYVNHEDGTRLVIESIEKFWCPTISSEDLLRGRI